MLASGRTVNPRHMFGEECKKYLDRFLHQKCRVDFREMSRSHDLCSHGLRTFVKNGVPEWHKKLVDVVETSLNDRPDFTA